MAAFYGQNAALYQFDNSECDIEYDVNDVSNENKNTKRKTETDMRIFSAYLISLKEMRKAEEIPPQELDPYLSMFFSVVKKHDGHEYEPASLRGMLCSIERYLRMKGYQNSVTRDAAFNNTRNTLKNKQRILRENGKGMKKLVSGTEPNALGPSTIEKLNHLYIAKELGPYNPMSVINSLCFAFVIYFKMRKAIDHKQLLWGDIVLRSSATSEYLCYEPLDDKEYLRPKLKGIEDCRVWNNSVNGPNKDPILIYKLYSQKRPSQMMSPESPFYLGVSTSHPVHNQPWYKSLPMGVNKLNDLVRMIRDITGIQRVQTASNPNSPENINHPISPGDSNKEDLNSNDQEMASTALKNRHINQTLYHSMVKGKRHLVRNGSTDSQDHLTIDQDVSPDHVERNDRIGDEEAVDLSCVERAKSSYSRTENPIESGETCVSLEEVKDTILHLAERLTRDRRKELVKWMNSIMLDKDGISLLESKRQSAHYQITIDLNSEDLTSQQSLELTGRIKHMTEVKERYEKDTCNQGSTETKSQWRNDDTISENFGGNLVENDKKARQKLNNHKFIAMTDGIRTEPKSFSLPLKRSMSEGISSTVYDSEENKKLKFCYRNYSHQETDVRKESSDMPSSSVSLESEDHGTHDDDGDVQVHSFSTETETDENTKDLAKRRAVALSSSENRMHSQLYPSQWIPSQMFQQIAYHPLTSYTDPRLLQLYRQNTELPSMESVFQQPFDTNLLRRVYANIDSVTMLNSAQNVSANAGQVSPTDAGQTQNVIEHIAESVEANTCNADRSESHNEIYSPSSYT